MTDESGSGGTTGTFGGSLWIQHWTLWYSVPLGTTPILSLYSLLTRRPASKVFEPEVVPYQSFPCVIPTGQCATACDTWSTSWVATLCKFFLGLHVLRIFRLMITSAPWVHYHGTQSLPRMNFEHLPKLLGMASPKHISSVSLSQCQTVKQRLFPPMEDVWDTVFHKLQWTVFLIVKSMWCKLSSW